MATATVTGDRAAETLRDLALPWGPVRIAEAGADRGGVPLLLVHGMSGSHGYWLPVLRLLGRDRHVVAVDLPGFGASPRARRSRYRLEEAADDLAAIATAVGADRFDVMGHSAGGAIAAMTVIRHPARVRSLGLCAAISFRPMRGYVSWRAGPVLQLKRFIAPAIPLLARRRGGLQRLIARLAQDTSAIDDATAAEIVRAALVSRSSEGLGIDAIRRRLGPQLAGATLPVLVIWGEDDASVPVASIDEITPYLPQARVIVRRGSGHVPMLDDPEAFAAAVVGFLAEADAEPGGAVE